MAEESRSQDSAGGLDENERLREVIRALHKKSPDLFVEGLDGIPVGTRELVSGVLDDDQALEASETPDSFDFDTVKPREGALRRSELTRREGIIGSENADMGFDPSPAVQAALDESVKKHGYLEVPGALDDAIVSWLKKIHNWNIDKNRESIVKLNDSNSAITAACKAFAKQSIMPGRRGSIVACLPAYYAARIASENAGIPLKTISLIEGTNEIDTAALSKVLKKGDVFILTNPHNPTGHVHTREELLAIKEICDAKNVTMVVDELHDGLVLDKGKEMVSMGSLYEAGETNNTVTLLSTGKSFNLSATPCPMMIVPDEKKREQFKAQLRAGGGMRADHISNPVANGAAIAAYTESDEWREELIKYLRINAKMVFDRINAMKGLSMQMPEGTHLAWIDARDAGLDEEPADFFAKKADVAVYAGRNFDVEGETDYSQFFRLNVALPLPELKKMLDKIGEALPK